MSKIGFFRGMGIFAGFMLYLYSFSVIQDKVSIFQLMTINLSFIFMLFVGLFVGLAIGERRTK